MAAVLLRMFYIVTIYMTTQLYARALLSFLISLSLSGREGEKNCDNNVCESASERSYAVSLCYLLETCLHRCCSKRLLRSLVVSADCKRTRTVTATTSFFGRRALSRFGLPSSAARWVNGRI